MIAMYLVLVVLLAAMLWMLHAALSQSKGGKHRGPRRYRPSGDLLGDRGRDDNLEDWPPERPTLAPQQYALKHFKTYGNGDWLIGGWLEPREPYEGKVYTAADLPTVQWDPRLPAPKVPVEPTVDEVERIVQRVREEANGDG